MFAGELKKQKALFALADTAGLIVAATCAVGLYDPDGSIEKQLSTVEPIFLLAGGVVAVFLWAASFSTFDLYRMRNGGWKEARAIIKACTLASALLLLAGFVLHIQMSRIEVGSFYLISIPAVLLMRLIQRNMIRRFYSSPGIAIPVVIVGFNSIAHYLCDRMEEELTQYEPVGFLDSTSVGRAYHGHPVFGDHRHLEHMRLSYPALEVAIALPDASLDEQAQIVGLCEQYRLRWWMVPWVYRSAATGLRLDTIGVIPVVGPRGTNVDGLNYLIKRVFDIACSSVILVFALPLIALAALAIWISDRGPIFFHQERVGVQGQLFRMLKLRTMRVAAADGVHREYVQQWISKGQSAAASAADPTQKVFKLHDDPRITRVGKLLRRFSLDELPQLFNVVRGDMSLIGPRPALPYELELYQDWHRRRLDGMPGITGLWQVSGRNHLSFDDMVRLDVQYLEEWSLTTDLRILLRTIPVMIRGSGM
jgi:exopolysaccharide biosynthesis polyprenyl glycosylphosphotransferase